MNGNLGPFSVETHQYRDWFLGPNMWFGSWGNHVAHWWKRSQTDANVLFLRFEDLKNDLSLAVDQIATLLEIDALTQAEKNRITAACSFEYMKQNADAFEMYPPHLFQSQADFFVSGNKRRFQDVSSDIAAEILEKCIQQLREQGVDTTQIYPSITGKSETKSMAPASLTTDLSPCETTQQSAVAG